MTMNWISVSVWFLVLVTSFMISCGAGDIVIGATGTATSETVPDRPHAREASASPALVPTMIIKLVINGDDVALQHLQIVMAPSRKPRKLKSGLISVTGKHKGDAVNTVQASDARVNIEEHKGTVIMENREVVVAFPLPRRIDSFEILLSGRTQPVHLTPKEDFSVQEAIDEFCDSYRHMPLCRS
jgi:hypothetical protein